MGSSPISPMNSKSARATKLRGLAGVVFCLSATIPFTTAAATPSTEAESHHHHANLTVQHWRDMNYDQYLRTYPNGNVMNLPEYVDHLSMSENFECGVGKHCRVSPLGQSSLPAPDWYILFATSTWNSYVNSLVRAFKKSTSLVKDTTREVLTDLVYEYNPHKTTGILNEVDLLSMLLMPIEAGGNQDERISEETHEADWMAAVKPIARLTPKINGSAPKNPEPVKYARMKRHMVDNSAVPTLEVPLIVYNSTKPIETNLEQLSNQMQDMLVQSIENKINSPISLETGIYSALQHGRFASPNVDLAHLSKNARNITSLFIVSSLLNHENAMIVVRKSHCSHYRKELEHNPTRLAFCSSDDTLIEIVLVDGEENYMRDIFNAHLIRDKYGFKTSFLASEALRCQQSIDNLKNNQPQEEDNDNPYEVCTFRLPICNLKEQHDQDLLNAPGNLVRICREEIGLPI